MNTQQIIAIAFMLVLAGVSVWFGHTITIQSLTQEKTDEFREKAFQAAKTEYLEYFHRRFTSNGEKIAEAFNAAVIRENEALKEQNQLLKEELAKERKKNESTGSN